MNTTNNEKPTDRPEAVTRPWPQGDELVSRDADKMIRDVHAKAGAARSIEDRPEAGGGEREKKIASLRITTDAWFATVDVETERTPHWRHSIRFLLEELDASRREVADVLRQREFYRAALIEIREQEDYHPDDKSSAAVRIRAYRCVEIARNVLRENRQAEPAAERRGDG